MRFGKCCFLIWTPILEMFTIMHSVWALIENVSDSESNQDCFLLVGISLTTQSSQQQPDRLDFSCHCNMHYKGIFILLLGC